MLADIEIVVSTNYYKEINYVLGVTSQKNILHFEYAYGIIFLKHYYSISFIGNTYFRHSKKRAHLRCNSSLTKQVTSMLSITTNIGREETVLKVV